MCIQTNKHKKNFTVQVQVLLQRVYLDLEEYCGRRAGPHVFTWHPDCQPGMLEQSHLTHPRVIICQLILPLIHAHVWIVFVVGVIIARHTPQLGVRFVFVIRRSESLRVILARWVWMDGVIHGDGGLRLGLF